MINKFFLNLLLILSFYPSFFYSSHKTSKHRKLIDGAQLFFPSKDVRLNNVSPEEKNKIKDLRLKLLSEAVHDSQLVRVAHDFYLNALTAEIDKKFDIADKFAVQGYKTMLLSQPYGYLLEKEDSLPYNLWNLLQSNFLPNKTVNLIKKALWQETQRDLFQKQYPTYQDVLLLHQITEAYLDRTLSPKEESILQYIMNILKQIKKAEIEGREQQRLQKLEEERSQALLEEELRQLRQEELERKQYEESLQRLEEELRRLRKEELERKQYEEKIQRFEQERLLVPDGLKRYIREFIMKYDGEINESNRVRFNTSLYNGFFHNNLYYDRYFANARNKVIRMDNIGQNKFFDAVIYFLDKHYPGTEQSAQPKKVVLTKKEGHMEIKSDPEFIRRKGFLILSEVPELIPYLVDLSRSDLDPTNYNINVLIGTTKDGDSIQCVILPKYDSLFYQIERFTALGATKVSEDSSLASSSTKSAAVAASSYSVPPLPVWRKVELRKS